MTNITEDPELENIPEEGPLEKKYKLFQEKQHKIDMKLIIKTSISSTVAASLSEEEKVDVLVALKVIHLEWLNIKQIENLDVFTNLETLYLQYNQIERIDNLDMLINLEYLALNNNRIKRIENLNHLKKLAFLNIAENQIEDFDENELPDDLVIIKLNGNPCTEKPDYLKKILDRIPNIEEIDGKEVTQVLRMVAMGKLPASMLGYADTAKEIANESNNKQTNLRNQNSREEHKHQGLYKGNSNRQRDNVVEGEEDEIDEEDEEEDEEGEGDEEEDQGEDEEKEEEEKNEVILPSRRSEVSLGTEGRTGNSDLSTAHSRIDESGITELGDSDVTVLREKTEKLLKRMKERHAQQLQDTMQEIKESRNLYDDIIKIYKSQETKGKK